MRALFAFVSFSLRPRFSCGSRLADDDGWTRNVDEKPSRGGGDAGGNVVQNTGPGALVELMDVTAMIKGIDEAGKVRCCCDDYSGDMSTYIWRFARRRSGRCVVKLGLSSCEELGQRAYPWQTSAMVHYSRKGDDAACVVDVGVDAESVQVINGRLHFDASQAAAAREQEGAGRCCCRPQGWFASEPHCHFVPGVAACETIRGPMSLVHYADPSQMLPFSRHWSARSRCMLDFADLGELDGTLTTRESPSR